MVTEESPPPLDVPAIAASMAATGIYGAMSQIDQLRESLEDQGRTESEDYTRLTTLYGNLDAFADAQGLKPFDPRSRTFKL